MNTQTNEIINDKIYTCTDDKCCDCKNNSPAVPRLHTLFLGVTEDCNMRCRYCFVQHNPARMSLDTAMKALYFLLHSKTQTVRKSLTLLFLAVNQHLNGILSLFL